MKLVAQPNTRDLIELHAKACPVCREGRLQVAELAGETLVACSKCGASGQRIRRAAGFAR